MGETAATNDKHEKDVFLTSGKAEPADKSIEDLSAGTVAVQRCAALCVCIFVTETFTTM